MKTYDVVAAAIEAQETGHCFALLGDGNMHFAGALAHLGMPFTYSRHEHCAVSMAMAYARVTERPGLATVYRVEKGICRSLVNAASYDQSIQS